MLTNVGVAAHCFCQTACVGSVFVYCRLLASLIVWRAAFDGGSTVICPCTCMISFWSAEYGPVTVGTSSVFLHSWMNSLSHNLAIVSLTCLRYDSSLTGWLCFAHEVSFATWQLGPSSSAFALECSHTPFRRSVRPGSRNRHSLHVSIADQKL